MDALSAKLANKTHENDRVLDTLHEEIKSRIGTNKKFKIYGVDSPSFYLPTLFRVGEIFGLLSTHKQLLNLIEKNHDVSLDISRNSKYELFNNGVSFGTIRKLIEWSKSLPINLQPFLDRRFMVKMIHSFKAGSNAGEWLAYMLGNEVGENNSNLNTEPSLAPLIAFIKHRCDTEVRLKLDAIQQVKEGKRKDTDLGAWQHMQLLFMDSPCYSESIFENIEPILSLDTKLKTLTKKQELAFIESYCHLHFDFYLEVITNLDIGFKLPCYYENVNFDELDMLNKAINAFATDDDIKSCFHGLLRELEEYAFQHDDKKGCRKLSRFIDIEEAQSGNYGESLTDKQYNQLKDWRRGKNLPSDKKLITFLQNFDDYIDFDIADFTFITCRIVMGVDKLVNEFIQQFQSDNCNSKELVAVTKKILATMPEYYKVNLKKQLDKIEPTGK